MHNETYPIEDSSDRYCSLLKSYYERLKDESSKSSSKVATEEVKLRLFLSLLDRPKQHPHESENFGASPL
jgi:hypothetical protein